jgi:hypothetical protein
LPARVFPISHPLHPSTFLLSQIRREDVKSAWSGIRPLIRDPKKLAEPGAKSSQLSRSHVVDVSPSGMVSILGGKWTTYRRMAEEAIDAFKAGPAKSRGITEIGPSKTLHMQVRRCWCWGKEEETLGRFSSSHIFRPSAPPHPFFTPFRSSAPTARAS